MIEILILFFLGILTISSSIALGAIIANAVYKFKEDINMINHNIGILDKGVSDLYDILLGEDDDDMKGYE